MFTTIAYPLFRYHNSANIEIEIRKERDEIKLKEFGLYPKNILLMNIGGYNLYKYAHLYSDYANKQDIEDLAILRDTGILPISNLDWGEFVSLNWNLNADFIIKMKFNYLGECHITNRTYENLYKLAQYFQTSFKFYPYTKPKNSKEKLYYEKCLAQNTKFINKQFSIVKYVETICSYIHFHKN